MLILVLALSGVLQGSASPPAAAGVIDVSTLTVAAPVPIVELDLGKLKGELRRIAWAPDGSRLYIQTAEGNAPSPKLRHYGVALEGGAIQSLDGEPDWAKAYWEFKSDRAAPGLGGVMIDVEQKIENMKYGTGSAGAADRTSSGLGGDNINAGANVEKAAQSEHVNVVRLKLYDEVISEFANTQPVPGLLFGWGPEKSAAVAYVDVDGRLMLLDKNHHKRAIAGTRDALLPAWSTDGTRLAWAQKSGRRKYALVYATVRR
jgi:hypothetical protein